MTEAACHVTLSRIWLKQNGFDGLIVPMSDEFQTEYVPAHSKRLEWLTGFRGSRALAVIAENSALLSVPGLYELQAKAQTNPLFTINVTLGRGYDISAWVESLPETAKIACDARVVTPALAAELIDELEPYGHTIEWLVTNPIDELWHGRPTPNEKPLFAYADKFSGESSQSKRSRIANTIADEEADCALITLSDSICWLLNVRGFDAPITPYSLSYAIVHNNGNVDWFVENHKLTAEVIGHLGNGVTTHELDRFWQHLSTLAGVGILVESSSMPFAALLALEEGKAEILDGNDPCQRPKAQKNCVEVEQMRAVHVRDGAILSRYMCWLEKQLLAGETITELQAARTLTAMRAEDSEFLMVSFPPISAAGAHAALPHYGVDEESDAEIKLDQCYLVDSGGQYRDGGTTDVTRTIWLENPSAEFCDAYTRVLKGHLAIDMQQFPAGTNGARLDSLARQYLWQAGLDYAHGTGHGVGALLNVHEGPQGISLATYEPIVAGNIISNEPGHYVEGAYGIRIENLVVIQQTENGWLQARPITLSPIDTRPIVMSLMTDQERKHLNDYHARVLLETGPLVDDETLIWLTQRCQAI